MASQFAAHRPEDKGVPLEVEVRRLARTDIDLCVGLAVAREGPPPEPWRDSFFLDLDDHNGDQRATFVAVGAGEVVGYASTRRLTPVGDGGSGAPDGWYLTGVVVSEQFRRRGVATQLTTARLHWLAPRTETVWYFAAVSNRASIDLHAAFGFQEITGDFSIPGVRFRSGPAILGVLHLD